MTQFSRLACLGPIGALPVSGYAFSGGKSPSIAENKSAAKGVPSDESVNAAIDVGFQRWSAAWMFDRYIPGSARISDRALKDGTYVIRGVFDFARMGAMQTIPFAAAFSKSKESYALSNLCYNDITSGMTDCINPSDNLGGQHAAAMQSRQFLGAVVLLGLVAAMSAVAEEETWMQQQPQNDQWSDNQRYQEEGAARQRQEMEERNRSNEEYNRRNAEWMEEQRRQGDENERRLRGDGAW